MGGGHLGHGAAQLEGAGELEVLGLEEEGRGAAGGEEWGFVDVGADAGAGLHRGCGGSKVVHFEG